jgi:Ser/Thr protein kinase RdoA (MazF antagonist)
VSDDLEAVCAEFHIVGDYLSAAPFGSGHIHATYRAAYSQAGRTVHYLLQRMNVAVFHDPVAVMENITRICSHQATRVRADADADVARRVLRVVNARSGGPLVADEAGGFWRCSLFVEGARSYDVVETEAQAYQAGDAFAAYLGMLTDLPGKPLHETIPDFHHTRRRFDMLLAAVHDAPQALARAARDEWAFFRDREPEVEGLLDLAATGALPIRNVHNDTKLNNVLLDDRTGRAVCVIDLDTTMPGLSAYDYGDLIRTSTSPVPEDHPRADEVEMRFPLFAAVTNGFLAAGRAFLTDAEVESLPLGAKLMTMEVGMRFLTDYLTGSKYYKVEYPDHNLIRARTQIALTRAIEGSGHAMREHVARSWQATQRELPAPPGC